MKRKLIIITLVCAVSAFLLGRVIWPDSSDVPMLSGIQFASLVFISGLEALAFGAGISFIIFGRSLIKRLPSESSRHRNLAFWSIAWTLVSWWPHDNMHRANGITNVWGLIKIEYLFHLTLIICAFIIASYFIRTILVKRESYYGVEKSGE